MRNKILIIISVILLLSVFTADLNAEVLDYSQWYAYNGASTSHSFSVNFPTNWHARTFGDKLQGFSPKGEYDKISFSIKEFEGQSYQQVINYYIDENIKYSSEKDIILLSGTDDILAKQVVFDNLDLETGFRIILIKRGGTILVLTSPDPEITENYSNSILETMLDSFKFTDNWRQYIDYKEKYTFVYPSNLKINRTSKGVEVYDAGDLNNSIFTIKKYENTSIEDIKKIETAENEIFIEEQELDFHDIEKVIVITYKNEIEGKKFSKIFVENKTNTYSLTNINIENDYPHQSYYDTYIVEILESFEFFEVEGDYYNYKNFPDVRENHPNAKAIDTLTFGDIIAGYPDGTFLPDGDINRAELTKMIVATKANPGVEKYNNCFPDVEDQWFAAYICYAKEKGWVDGYPDGSFRPDNNINRVEAMKIILEVLLSENINEEEELLNKTVIDIDPDSWYLKYFIFADNNQLLDKQHIIDQNGTYYFLPAANMSRKEVAEMIYRSLELMKMY